MDALMKYHFDVDGSDFTRAGETSSSVKKILRSMGFSPETIRRVAIAMYEGEINMVTATSQIRELGFGAGMGIPNMKKYSDEMDIDTEVGVGTTLTLTFYPEN